MSKLLLCEWRSCCRVAAASSRWNWLTRCATAFGVEAQMCSSFLKDEYLYHITRREKREERREREREERNRVLTIYKNILIG